MELMVPGGAPLVAYLLASARITAWLLLAPPWSSRSFPSRAKVLLALALALLVVPAKVDDLPATVPMLVVAMVQEVAIGASLGFVVYLVLAAVQAAGDLVDVFGGFSLAAAYDPLSFQMNSVFGRFYQLLASLLLFASGAHLLVLGGLLMTFRKLPVGASFDVARMGEVVPEAFSLFLVCAVQIALPIIAVMFVTDLGLALMTKVAPHLNAIGIMFPLKIALTLLTVGLSLSALPVAVERLVDLAGGAMQGLLT